MVPIHDTDVAQERWVQSEWQNYELWERVEHRFKRKRRLWIFATVIIFVLLSAIPIVLDRWPKWMTRSISRHLVHEINQIKIEASINRAAYRLRFVSENTLDYVVEKMSDCSVGHGEEVRSASLVKESLQGSYLLVTPARGKDLDIPGLTNTICYDYLTGNASALKGDEVIGFGIIPANDLTERRLDRLTVLLLTGPSAESSFD